MPNFDLFSPLVSQIEIDDGNKKFEKKKWIVMRTLSKYLGVASLFQLSSA